MMHYNLVKECAAYYAYCCTNQHLLGVTGSHHIDAIQKKNHENIFRK